MRRKKIILGSNKPLRSLSSMIRLSLALSDRILRSISVEQITRNRSISPTIRSMEAFDFFLNFF